MVVPNKLGYYLILNVFNVNMTTPWIAVIDVTYNGLRYVADLPLMVGIGGRMFSILCYKSFRDCIGDARCIKFDGLLITSNNEETSIGLDFIGTRSSFVQRQ